MTEQEQIVSTLPASFTPQQREELFGEIVRLYDLADEVLSVVGKHEASCQNVQAELAKPFATQVANSANILSAFYTEVVHKGRPITPELQDTFESAFRNIFQAYKDFIDTVEEKLLQQKAVI